jgi:hypothetical protein
MNLAPTFLSMPLRASLFLSQGTSASLKKYRLTKSVFVHLSGQPLLLFAFRMVPLADAARLRNATRVRRHRGLVSVEGYRLSVERFTKLSGIEPSYQGPLLLPGPCLPPWIVMHGECLGRYESCLLPKRAGVVPL